MPTTDRTDAYRCTGQMNELRAFQGKPACAWRGWNFRINHMGSCCPRCGGPVTEARRKGA